MFVFLLNYLDLISGNRIQSVLKKSKNIIVPMMEKMSIAVLMPLPTLRQGVRRFEARVRVVDALKERQLFRGRQDHAMSLPVCRYHRP